ncbi:hypothetical protein [Dactylosporangium sp. CA-233914]|uniref:hypothetical protein n=1 Tax=Dactylosporangium sp. CA-233914 TaxID=3239934 RepID=UPI003D94D81D
MPGEPNRLANLVGMKPVDRSMVTEAWRVWKVGLNGATRTQAPLMPQALDVDMRYGHLMVFPR